MATFVDPPSEKIAIHVQAKVPLNREARLFCLLCKLSKDDPTARQTIAHTNIFNLEDNIVFWSTSMSLNYSIDRKDKYVLQIRESFVEAEKFPQLNQNYPLIGETTRFTLNTLISSPTYEGLHTLQLPFQQDADDSDPNYLPDAIITVRGDLITEPIEYLSFGLNVRLLPNRKSVVLGSLLTSLPKPFVVISRPVADDEGKISSAESKDDIPEEKKDLHVRIWRNHPPDSPHSTYVFGTIADGIPLPVLNHGDESKLIRFEVFDGDLNTSIGYEDITLTELLRRNSLTSFVSLKLKPSPNTMKTHRLQKTDAPCGYLNISDIRLERKFSFPQYLLGGCQIAVTIGIDCTRQTRNLHQPLSLSTPSMFHQALADIIPILQNYDSDKHYPTYCFGAQLPHADGSWSVTEHTFPLHTDIQGLFGVQRVLQAYDSFHKNVKYSFPRLFVPVFHKVLQDAVRVPCTATNQVYQVLLYFTEGMNGDEEGMIDAIIASSELPITIIIVGIESPKSNNSASNRNHFDGFSKYKPTIDQETGRRMFVHKGGNRFVDRENLIFIRYHEMSKEQMARYISDKLSEQVVDYFTRVKIFPNVYHTE